MTLGQLLIVIRARWLLGLLVLVLTLAAVVTAGLLMTRKYTASAAVMLEVRLPDPVAGAVNIGGTVENYIATQADVVQSERVALLAMRSMQPADVAALRREWQEETGGAGQFDPWLAERIVRPLTVRPSKDSSVIQITYTSENPRFAASMTNAITSAYIETTMQLRREPAQQYNSFFDDRAKAAREALEQAQAKLSKYQQSKGLIATDERLDVENARLAELSSLVVAIEGVTADSKSRQVEASTRGDRLPEVLGNTLISTLSTELARDETRLQEITSRLGEQHPQVVELRAHAKELKARLDSVTSRAIESVSVSNKANLARLAEVRGELASQRAKVMQLKGLRDESQVLQRDVESAQRAYEGLMTRVNQAQVESQNRLTNVSVLKHASEPVLPSSPKLKLMVGAAAVLGALLGLAAMVIREHMDRRLRSEGDVALQLGQTLLVTLPAVRLAGAHARPQRHQRLLDGLARPRSSAGNGDGGSRF